MGLTLFDKTFSLYIDAGTIQARIQEMARRMNTELGEEQVIFVGVLNGAFMFVSDLLRNLDFNASVSFVKLSSYQGTSSSGRVKSLIGFSEDVSGKTVVLLEDIVDTGITIESILDQISSLGPRRVLVATLLFKPDAYKRMVEPDYIGFRIPNRFVVGYGLDYEGLGRNLRDLYMLE
jgi:hypoxanthine phosphoribosyltransferase